MERTFGMQALTEAAAYNGKTSASGATGTLRHLSEQIKPADARMAPPLWQSSNAAL